MTKVTSRREGLFGAFSSREIGVHHSHGRKHGRKQAGKAMEQQLRAYIPIHKHKAEREH